MKTTLLGLILCALTSAYSQVPLNQQRISAAPWSTAPGPTNASAISAPGITNQFGQAYSATELANQLTALNAAVQQTLPALAAFNAQVASAGTSRGGQLANAISGVLSGALHHGTNQNGTATSSGYGITNVTQALNGLLSTNTNANNPAAASVDSQTISQLRQLQTDLAPVASLLQALHFGTNSVSGMTYPGQSVGSQPVVPSAPSAPTGR